MYRILVVDDEPLERLTMQQVLQDYLGDTCEVSVASNGREAVELAESMGADIILMDIEMPGINGLEASRMIRAELPDCHIIFLTAYSEFDYVREAISLGADNYLLKPCADSEVRAVFDKAIARIDTMRAEQQRKAVSTRTVKRLTRWLEEEIILNVVGGYMTPERLEDTLAELNLQATSGVCLILRSGCGMSPLQLRCLFGSGNVLGSYRIVMCEYDDCLYVMALCNEPGRDCAAEMYAEMQHLLTQKDEFALREVYCAIGTTFCDLSCVQASFFRAHSLIGQCSAQTPICLFQRKEGVPAEALDTYESHFSASLLGGDVQQAEELTLALYDWLHTNHKDNAMVVYLMGMHLRKALRQLADASGQTLDERLLPVLFVEDDKEKHRAQLTAAVHDIAARLGGVKTDRMSQMRYMIADYIRQNYKEDIFLEQIARDMNYSEAYFSKLFKQFFEKSFVHYLTEVRVEAAKELLNNPKINIKDVGYEVGYRDNNYFTKVFRRSTGQSPTEYRAGILPQTR